MQPRLTQDFSNFLSKIHIRVIGSNQYIFPLPQTEWCRIEPVTPDAVRLIFLFEFSSDQMVLCLERKGEREIQIRVESFFGSPFDADLYFQNNRIWQGLSQQVGKEIIVDRLALPLTWKLHPVLPAVPHIEGKSVVAVITTFNGLEWTKRCVESIRNLKTSHNISIVISDNCSTDGSREWFEKEGISYYSLFGRRPVSAGLNLGLRKAMKLKPDYIMVMNNDVLLPQDYLDGLVDHYEDKRKEGCLFITGYIRNMDYSNPDIVKVKSTGMTADMEDFMDTGDFSCFLITPETIEKMGYFDENFTPRYGEDNDYLHRIYAAGCKAFRTGQASFYHEWGTIFKVHPIEKESHIPTFRKNLIYYKEKWGDFPKGAERHGPSKDLTKDYPCKGGGVKPKEVKTWLRDQVALIQMGHIGDVIATLPVAKEIHAEGEQVVWLVNQRYLSLLETVKYIDEIVPFPDASNPYDSIFGKMFQEALNYAEKDKFRRVVIAQINPKHQDEFYKSPYPHNKFHYILCLGRMPKSLKPDLPIVPFKIKKNAEFTIGLILVSHSLPIYWGRTDLIDNLLQKVSNEMDVEYLNLTLEGYQGKTPVKEMGEDITIHQLSGAINNLDLLLTVDTGAYYPGLVTKTPIIHMLPKPRFTAVKEAPSKYTCEGQGFSEFHEIIDYWFDGSLQDLDGMIITRLSKGTDLREVKKGYEGMSRTWLTL